MMCDNCTIAGELNTEGKTNRATHWHMECEYPKSCTCQHMLGEGTVSDQKKRHSESNSVPDQVS